MREESSDFTNLRTVSTFDPGEASTLAIGESNLRNFSASSLLVESLIDQLSKLLGNDAQSQRQIYKDVCKKLHQMKLIDSSYDLEEFQYMRSYYQKALFQLLSVAQTTRLSNNALCTLSRNLSRTESIGDWSRYSAEFLELDFIAKGGFGQVYKAKHKLDGSHYAVKKILLRYKSSDGFLKSLREVKMLARVNHPNIVAYKAAWLEPVTSDEVDTDLDDSLSKSSTDSSLEVVFQTSSQEKIEVSYQHSEVVVEEEDAAEETSLSEIKAVCEYKGGDFHSKSRMSALLFIQMELCQQTLRKWLDSRNQSLSPEIKSDQRLARLVFKEVVEGVAYIHSLGIVHHDIKPSNIFVNEDLTRVQVGDFGLACCLLNHSSGANSSSSNDTDVSYTSHQPGQVGTKLYAAPEQLRDVCHPKSDVFSLGIVLFELICPFSTAMERSIMISDLRKGNLPDELSTAHPSLTKLIKDCVNRHLNQRPGADELLLKLNQSEQSELRKLVSDQQLEIQQLRVSLTEKDAEIQRLRAQLQSISNK